MTHYIATVRNGTIKAEVSAKDAPSALRDALTTARNQNGFELHKLDKLTVLDALNLCTAPMRSPMSRFLIEFENGYTFTMERIDGK